MRYFKLLGMALLSVMALSVAMSASASAAVLPDIHLLPGTEEATAEGTIGKAGGGKNVAVLETEIGSSLKAEELKALLTIKKLSSLGPADLHFVGVTRKAGEPCETAGDSEGTVLVPGEWHIVFTSLKPLEAAVLYLLAGGELLVKCLKEKKETVKIKITKDPLAHLVANDMEMVEKFGVTAACAGKGKQALTEYENDEGVKVKTLLEANFGVGLENGCESFTEELKLTSKPDIEFLI